MITVKNRLEQAYIDAFWTAYWSGDGEDELEMYREAMKFYSPSRMKSIDHHLQMTGDGSTPATIISYRRKWKVKKLLKQYEDCVNIFKYEI